MRLWLLAMLSTGCFSEPARPACTAPRKLEVINSTAEDSGPWLSRDRLEMIFASNRENSFDLYRAVRTGAEVNFSTPVRMTGVLDENQDEADPFVMPDGRTVYFTGTKPGFAYGVIFEATRPSEDSAELTIVRELTELDEARHASLTADGLAIYFDAYDGSYSQLYMANRARTSDAFSGPARVPGIDVERIQSAPSISGDGNTLVFAANAPNEAGRLVRVVRGDDGMFGPPEDVAEADAQPDRSDYDPYQMPDGHTILFASTRTPTGTNDNDIYISCE